MFNFGNEIKIECPSCGCIAKVDKNATTHVCLLCNAEINVQRQLAKEKAKRRWLGKCY